MTIAARALGAATAGLLLGLAACSGSDSGRRLRIVAVTCSISGNGRVRQPV